MGIFGKNSGRLAVLSFLVALSAQATNPQVVSIEASYEGGWPHLSSLGGRYTVQGAGGVYYNPFDAYFGLTSTAILNSGDSVAWNLTTLEAKKVRIVYHLEWHGFKPPIYRVGPGGSNQQEYVVFQRAMALQTYADSTNPLTACTLSSKSTDNNLNTNVVDYHGDPIELLGGINSGGHQQKLYPPNGKLQIQRGFLYAELPVFVRTGRVDANGLPIWEGTVEVPYVWNFDEEDITTGLSASVGGTGYTQALGCYSTGKWVFRLVKVGRYVVGGLMF